MSKSRKNPKYDLSKLDVFHGLGVIYDYDGHYEAIGVVEELIESIRNDLYSSSRDMRAHVYLELLRQTSELIEIDGGPTFALELFRRTMENLKLAENERGTKVIGPFLTKDQLKVLRRAYKPPIEVPETPKWGERPKKRTRR